MKIPLTQFKAKCLKLMNMVARTREPVVITKHGREVARLVHAQPDPDSLFGYMKGTVRFVGEVLAPNKVQWSALVGDKDHFYADLRTTRSRARRVAKRKAGKA